MPRRKANRGNITGTEESKTAKSIRVFRINELKVYKKDQKSLSYYYQYTYFGLIKKWKILAPYIQSTKFTNIHVMQTSVDSKETVPIGNSSFGFTIITAHENRGACKQALVH